MTAGDRTPHRAASQVREVAPREDGAWAVMAAEAGPHYDGAPPSRHRASPGRGSTASDQLQALRAGVEAVAAAVETGAVVSSRVEEDGGDAADGGSSAASGAGAEAGVDVVLLRERLRLFERLAGLATTGQADTVRALSRAGAVKADGAASTAEWLKGATNRSGRDAARLARLATDLEDMPSVRRALNEGAITDESADAVVKAARDGRLGPVDRADAELAEVARSSSPEQLRATIKDRQQQADPAAMLRDERHQHATRKLRLWRRATGMWGVSGDLPDEVGQSWRTALDAHDHPDPKGTPVELRRRPEQRMADAMAAMTAAVLDGGLVPGTGGITRPHLSVLVPADTVSTDLTRPDASGPDEPAAAAAPDDARWADLPAGDLPWGGKLSPQAVRRICCDAAVSRIVMSSSSQVLDVGRATRVWSGPQRRAVNARDRGCRGPNCSRPIAWTQVHHLQWWRHDGPTSIDNGLALCHHCHRLVHDHGWTVSHDVTTSRASWTSPHGRVIVTTPRAATTEASPTPWADGTSGSGPIHGHLGVARSRGHPPAGPSDPVPTLAECS